MPEKSKNEQKNRNEPKEQRRKRQGRHPSDSVEKKAEKEVENLKATFKEKTPPPYVEPSPEFYKNLKRETEDILKITEEASSKYKKKEIQSNWAKYEMPIESYEEIDEQESIGADFESLIQSSLSVGGHFQFKHEKSWDISSGPTIYDKYFDIDMDNLYLALSSVPFYERNNIDKSFFTETDMQTMNHRAIKYKNKYFNDNKYTTPELAAESKLLSNLMTKEENEPKEITEKVKNVNVVLENKCNIIDNLKKGIEETVIELSEKEMCAVKDELHVPESIDIVQSYKKEKADEDSLFAEDVVKVSEICVAEQKVVLGSPLPQEKHDKGNAVVPERENKNPAIESPEDLEKWLDDFLDG